MPAAEDSLVVPAAGHIPAAGCGCTAVDCTGCENSDWDCIDFGTPPGSAAAADRRPDSAGDSSSLNSAADRSSDAVVDHIDASVAMHWCGRNSSGTELQLPHHWCFQQNASSDANHRTVGAGTVCRLPSKFAADTLAGTCAAAAETAVVDTGERRRKRKSWS